MPHGWPERYLYSQGYKKGAHTENCDIALAMFFYKQLTFVTALAVLLLQSQAAPAVYERQVCTAPDGTADDVAIGLCLHSREYQPAHRDVRQRRSLPMSKGGSRITRAEATERKYRFKTRTKETTYPKACLSDMCRGNS